MAEEASRGIRREKPPSPFLKTYRITGAFYEQGSERRIRGHLERLKEDPELKDYAIFFETGPQNDKLPRDWTGFFGKFMKNEATCEIFEGELKDIWGTSKISGRLDYMTIVDERPSQTLEFEKRYLDSGIMEECVLSYNPENRRFEGDWRTMDGISGEMYCVLSAQK